MEKHSGPSRGKTLAGKRAGEAPEAPKGGKLEIAISVLTKFPRRILILLLPSPFSVLFFWWCRKQIQISFRLTLGQFGDVLQETDF